MGAKGEISWKRRNEQGERMEFYARNERGKWKFFQRERRFEKWEAYELMHSCNSGLTFISLPSEKVTCLF